MIMSRPVMPSGMIILRNPLKHLSQFYCICQPRWRWPVIKSHHVRLVIQELPIRLNHIIPSISLHVKLLGHTQGKLHRASNSFPVFFCFFWPLLRHYPLREFQLLKHSHMLKTCMIFPISVVVLLQQCHRILHKKLVVFHLLSRPDSNRMKFVC